MQAVNQIMQELNALRMSEYSGSDYTNSDSLSMSSDDYHMFYGSLEIHELTKKL